MNIDSIIRLTRVVKEICELEVNEDILGLVARERDVFSGFRIIYSTDAIDPSRGAGMLFSDIEKLFPLIRKQFYGEGVVFISDRIVDAIAIRQQYAVSCARLVTLDSNVVEECRRLVEGKNPSDLKKIRMLIKAMNSGMFVFDYSLFMLENLTNALMPDNDRPRRSIAAMKMMEEVNVIGSKSESDEIQFKMDRRYALELADEVIASYTTNDSLMRTIYIDQRANCAVLMKAALLNYNKRLSLHEKLQSIVEFSHSCVGKVLRLPIFIAWKLFSGQDKHPFLAPILSRGKNTAQKIKGMSWDISLLNIQRIQLANPIGAEFNLPFLCSFDRRFVNFASFCKIRACVIDPSTKRVHNILLEENEFNEALSAIHSEISEHFTIRQVAKRTSTNLNIETIETLISELENEITVHVTRDGSAK